ncbi:MAG: hypothetical protein ACRECW_11015 [Phyllobacterium sp.]
MYSINEMPRQIPQADLDLLAGVETASGGHWRLFGFMHRLIQPLFPATSYSAIYLEAASSRLSSLVASIAYDVAIQFCALHDNGLANCSNIRPSLKGRV